VSPVERCFAVLAGPRRSRAVYAAPAPRQALAQAGCRVTPMQDRGSVVSRSTRLLRVFDRLPTGSFQKQQIRASGHIKAAFRSAAAETVLCTGSRASTSSPALKSR